jgi:two-component system response regulator HupR/HoxA
MASPGSIPEIDYRAFPVLVVDDEPDIVETFRFSFRKDFTVLSATSGRVALDIIAAEPVAVLVVDQRMPEMHGLEVIQRALELRPTIVPIILTGYTDLEALVSAINLGRIYRYLRKPWDRAELRAAIRQAIDAYELTDRNARLMAENARLVAELARANEQLAQENRFLKERDAGSNGFDAIVGRSRAILQVIERARRVVDSPTTVLIEGPTGSGKELVARAIHYGGPRRQKLFVALNTGAMTETLLASTLFGHRRGAFTGASTDQKGLFEIADGGTLFLDEVGEMSPPLQVHLLRVLQEGEVLPVGATRPVRVDVRVVAATNRDLAADVRAGRFRADLLHRLNVFPIRLPSLAERREDVPLLAEHIFERQRRRLGKRVEGIAPAALAALGCHVYSGNVRELENMIERALILAEAGQWITEAELFDRANEPAVPATNGTPPLRDEVIAFERERIRTTLARCDGNKSRAARELGLTYRGLLMKMQRYEMLPPGPIEPE